MKLSRYRFRRVSQKLAETIALIYPGDSEDEAIARKYQILLSKLKECEALSSELGEGRQLLSQNPIRMKDIVITLPRTENWIKYQRELLRAEKAGEILNFKVPTLPHESGKGARCFLVHNGLIQGWMFISGLVRREGFVCTTTGKEWPAANYVQRMGKFYPLKEKILFKGFQGFRYFNPQLHAIILEE